MSQQSIFAATLGLAPPWQVTSVKFSKNERRLDIFIDYNLATMLPCPVCGSESEICSEKIETWHHSDFFQNDAYLHATVPMIHCRHHCGCLNASVPWDHSRSRFVLLQDSSAPPLVS
ncbi:transposase family protein [Geobacter pelophilus]|uniref:Transposase family protein n=1 Tax=Geoanaerobacter pelophilus TaxID=60036 RepID=A0AAW4L963_9BACT|nr:transposase family protein [Geoanaerobacter pelophilus]MBT0666110.1 transposase family protein [Geoanaerobacter pelophilus]